MVSWRLKYPFARSRRYGTATWSCRYEIGWPEGVKVREAWGSDSFQAIISALQAIGSDTYTSANHQTGQLSFREAGNGYGFPVLVNLRDVMTRDDAKYF
jgi:hypothetical protein